MKEKDNFFGVAAEATPMFWSEGGEGPIPGRRGRRAVVFTYNLQVLSRCSVESSCVQMLDVILDVFRVALRW